ncbi:hypothetical protein [Methylibium sp.]|nr:hypothetical protein [Methylibium sp.]
MQHLGKRLTAIGWVSKRLSTPGRPAGYCNPAWRLGKEEINPDIPDSG